MATVGPPRRRSGSTSLPPARTSRATGSVGSVLFEARVLAGLVAIFFLSVLLALALVVVVSKVSARHDAVAITSGSMEPKIAVGDVVVHRIGSGVGLGPGTVITFRPDPRRSPVTHRIVAVNEADGTYVTRGDANRESDSTPVRPDQIVGVGTLRVPWVGLPAVWYQQRAWSPLALLALSVMVAIWMSTWAFPGRRSPEPGLRMSVRST
jgi:signal peptidase I